MQEDRDHKGFLDRMRSFIIEDAPEGESTPAEGLHENHVPSAHAPGHGSDDVDKMFADIEAEVSTKPGRPGSPKPAGPVAGVVTGPAAAPVVPSSAVANDVLPPDVQKVVKLIDALPAVLTREQVQPLLVATMDAASLSAQTVTLEVEDSRRRAEEGIAAANQEIARLEAEREETLARLNKLMEASRAQCADAVAAQQGRIGELTAALNTLARVSSILPAASAQERTETKS